MCCKMQPMLMATASMSDSQRTTNTALVAVHVVLMITGAVLTSLNLDQTRTRDGIYLVCNFIATLFILVKILQPRQEGSLPAQIPAEVVIVAGMSLALSSVVTVIQSRTLQIPTSHVRIFRSLLASTFDVSATYSLYRMIGVPVYTPTGIMLLGLFNALSVFSFTGTVRDLYIFYEEQDLMTSGSKWREVIPNPNARASDKLVNAELSSALQQKTEFTRDELKKLKVQGLSPTTFIEVESTSGTKYFQPVGEDSRRDMAPTIAICAALSLTFLTVTYGKIFKQDGDGTNFTLDGDQLVRGLIIVSMVILLAVGQQTKIIDPLTDFGTEPIDPRNIDGMNLTVSEIATISLSSVLAVFFLSSNLPQTA